MVLQQLPPGITKSQIRAALHKSHAQHKALGDAWDSLLTEHEGEWVATLDGQFVFGQTIEAALKQASRRGWPLDRIAIDYLAETAQPSCSSSG